MEIEWRGRALKRCEEPEACRPAVGVEANDGCERCVYRNRAPRMACRESG